MNANTMTRQRIEKLNREAERLAAECWQEERWNHCGAWWKPATAAAKREKVRRLLAEALRLEATLPENRPVLEESSEFMTNLRRTSEWARMEEEREKKGRQQRAVASLLEWVA